jgi:hypothetical protein
MQNWGTTNGYVTSFFIPFSSSSKHFRPIDQKPFFVFPIKKLLKRIDSEKSQIKMRFQMTEHLLSHVQRIIIHSKVFQMIIILLNICHWHFYTKETKSKFVSINPVCDVWYISNGAWTCATSFLRSYRSSHFFWFFFECNLAKFEM